MPFVLDASITACWCFPDEQSTVADAAMDRLLDDEAIVPALWNIEIRNILVVNERRNRIESADADAFLRDLGRLPIRVRRDADERGPFWGLPASMGSLPTTRHTSILRFMPVSLSLHWTARSPPQFEPKDFSSSANDTVDGCIDVPRLDGPPLDRNRPPGEALGRQSAKPNHSTGESS